jgi:hypothetical protein
MNKYLRGIVALLGLLFVFIGLRWLIDPAGIAKNLGMPLLEGLGRSSQIGDFGAFFAAGGSMVIIASIVQERTWLYAPAMMLGGAAVFRTLGWMIQGAALAVPQIAIELVLSALLLFAASRLPSR